MTIKRVSRTRFLIYSVVIILGLGVFAGIQAQQQFGSPDDAVKALATATKSSDRAALTAIFGEGVKDLISGDNVSDQNDFEEFSSNIAKATKLQKDSDQKYTLLIGEDEWPFAAPIVKIGERWKFDTDAAVDEVLNRRIGANEIDAAMVCRIYAIAQIEYFAGGDWDNDQVSEYAQKISSSPGSRDGLYWEQTDPDEPESPLGLLFAFADSEGYKAKQGTTESAVPFHGYYFKVLYGQGPSAPGGRYQYIINGNMIGGYALVAYPATWGNSGVMTFIINQEGRVYEKNLGSGTRAIAAAMTQYDPDATWRLSVID